MKRITFTTLTGLLALAAPMFAQTSTVGFAPANFGDFIVTSTPSNATGNSGVSTVYTSSGSQFNFGTGGALVNPMQFNYTVTGPNTATITSKTSASQPATVTNLVFSGRNSGTYTTVTGTNTTTGRFNLAQIPGAAPLSNVSARATVGDGKTAIVGFVIAGTMPRRVLIRADGPVLKAFGVSSALQHPMLTLYSGQAVVARNSGWGSMQSITTGTTSSGANAGATSGGANAGATTTVTGTMANGMFTGTLPDGSSFSTQLATANDFTQVGAFALPQGSNDDAIVAELPPGAYTVVVGPASTATGASTGSSSSGATTGTSSGSTSSGATTGTASTSTSSSGGMTSGGTSSGTSSSTTSSSSTASGGGTSSGGTSSGGTSSGSTSTATGSTASTGTTGASASGDVLVEVYFLQ